MKYLKSNFEFINDSKQNVIIPPDIPNTLNFWHGGNLDEYDDVIAQKNGRYEYGAGLYLTTHHETATKYAKGSRKLYLVTVEKGTDIKDATLKISDILIFVKSYVLGSKKLEILKRIEKYIKEGIVKSYIFNVIILNEKAIKSSNTRYLREFYIENGIDYEIVDNPFGWGEDMMVLYNMKKIKNIIQINPSDKILDYDLKKEES